MRLPALLFTVALVLPAALGAVGPPPPPSDLVLLDDGDAPPDADPHHKLWRRKGGRGGSRGGHISGHIGGSTKSSGGGKPATGSSKSGGAGRLIDKLKPSSSKSNAGGKTTTGSGPGRSFGNGELYGGGSTVPFPSGEKSPSGIIPTLGSTSYGGFGTGSWGRTSYRPYIYIWPQPYHFNNRTTGRNQVLPVTCACQHYEVCGCDATSDNSYLASIVGDGSYKALNHKLAQVAPYNGAVTLMIDGTLPNGTTAPGGTEDPNGGGAGLAVPSRVAWLGWPLAVVVVAAVWRL